MDDDKTNLIENKDMMRAIILDTAQKIIDFKSKYDLTRILSEIEGRLFEETTKLDTSSATLEDIRYRVEDMIQSLVDVFGDFETLVQEIDDANFSIGDLDL